MKSYWKIVLGVILIGGGLFYWYQVRPSKIYSFCHKVALESAVEQRQNSYPYSYKEGLFLQSDYESYYEQCLRKNGINK